MKKMKRAVSGLLCAAMTAAMLTGCGAGAAVQEDVTYSTGFSESGYYTNVKAKKYVTLPEDYNEIKVPADAIFELDEEDCMTFLETEYGEKKEITDREAQAGDYADIHFEGYVDGVSFESGKGEHEKLQLGSGVFIPGFEEQIIGHKKGEDFKIQVTFPAEYGETVTDKGEKINLSGKDVEFHITLNDVYEYELTDKDIQDAFGTESVMLDGTLVTDIATAKAYFWEKNELQSKERYITNYLMEKTKVSPDIPKHLIETRIALEKKVMDEIAVSEGVKDADALAAQSGYVDADDFIRDNTYFLVKDIHFQLTLQAVAEEIGYTATPEKVEAAFGGAEEAASAIETYGKEYVSAAVLKQDMLAYLAYNAVVED